MIAIKRFKSTSGSPVRVVRDGQVAWVETDWSPLPPFFHRQAYIEGCISEDMVQNTSTDYISPGLLKNLNKVAMKKERIKDAILQMIEENEISLFTNFRNKGFKPKATVLTERLGERVTNGDRDEIWFHMLKDGITQELEFN